MPRPPRTAPLPLLLHISSRACAHTQWPSWSCVRLLASSSSASSASSVAGLLQQQHAGVVVVPAEAAKAVSQHGSGLIKLPGDMLQTLEGYFQDANLSGKVSKQQALALTEKLKALSRSTAAGGLQPYRDNTPARAAPAGGLWGAGGRALQRQQERQHGMDAAMTQEQRQEQQEMDTEMEQLASAVGPEMLAKYRATRDGAAAAARLPLPRTKGGRLKSSARAALEAHIDQHGMLGLPHEAVRAAFGLPPSSSLMSESRGEAVKAVTPKYNATEALAYALARLPGCYAASARIFGELAVRLPALRPRSLLDYGAGPGTATWAAQEVWASSLSRLTAVEPSAPMAQLGRRLEAARRFVHPKAPLVRWRPDMPPMPLSARKQQSQQHGSDLVVASYVLGELPTQQERAALVRKLWGATTDMLVLIEPGTPAGFANILEARASILDYEGRRALKLQRRLDKASASSPLSADGGGDSSSSSSRGDAMLAAKASSRWFGAHVVAPCPHDAPCPLAVPGSRSWCHFGTRFQRPGFMQQAKAPAGSRTNPADHQDERYSYVVLRRGTRPVNTPQVDISRSFARRLAANLPAHSSRPPRSASNSSSSIAGASGVGLDERGTSPAAGLAVPSSGLQQLFSADELQHLASLLPAVLQQQTDAPQVEAQQPSQPVQAAAAAAAGRPQASSKLGAYGEGLINRLIAQEDAGVDWTLTGAAEATADLGSAAGSVQRAADSSGSSSQASHSHSQHDPQGHTDGPADAPSEGLLQAASSSSTWSRIIRPPRKRGGHILLDVCTGASIRPSEGSVSGAAIVRHVVARSDADKWMGAAGYELARSARWGDLWPAAYEKNEKKQVVSST